MNWMNCKCQKGHNGLESDKNSDLWIPNPNVIASVWCGLSKHIGWNEIDKSTKTDKLK